MMMMDSIFSTLKRLKDGIISEDEDEAMVNDPKPHHAEKGKKHRSGDHLDVSEDGHSGRSHHHSPSSSRKSSAVHASNAKGNDNTYASNAKGKDNTLLLLSQTPSEDPQANSESNRRISSMRNARSTDSVMRKINKDKNANNDRHYLLAVTEKILSEKGSETKDKVKH